MWNILKAEFNYNRTFFIVLVLVVIANILYSNLFFRCPSMGIINILITVIIISNTVILMNREKRIRHYTLLPISSHKIAIARILLILIPCIVILTIFAANNYLKIYIIYKNDSFMHLSLRGIMQMQIIFLNIIIIGFMSHFILHDLILPYKSFLSRKISIAIILIILIVGTVILQRMLIIIAKPALGHNILEFLRTYSPFVGEYGMHRLVAFTFLLSFISVFTFLKRKTYLV